MSQSTAYTEYHPKWLRTRVSTYWWLTRRSYLAFILRELSSVFVAWFVVYLLLLVRAVLQGLVSYLRFLHLSAHPIVLGLNLITLFFVVLHAITWFNLAPQALVIHLKGKRVPGSLISASNYLAWIVVSIGIAVLILRG
jgi:fumarate reductase subunit C